MEVSFWKHKKVWVTGGTGFIGRWLIKTLIKTGARIDLVDLQSPRDPEHQVDFIALDLRNINAIQEALLERTPQIIIHLAGQAGVATCHNNPVEALEANVLCTFNLLEAIRNTQSALPLQSLVATSSNHIYGHQEKTPTPETAPLNGLGTYAMSKLCADAISRCYGQTYQLPITLARITNSFGGDDPHQSHLVTATIQSVLEGVCPVIKGSGRDAKAFMYIEDTLDGIFALAEKTAVDSSLYGQAFNIVPDEPVSVFSLVQTIIDLLGSDLAPDIQSPNADWESEFLDNQHARRQLGWQPQYSLKEGLLKTIAWYQAPLAHPTLLSK